MSLRVVLIALGGLVVVVLLVLGGFWLHFAKQPPAVAEGARRFHVAEGGSSANNPGERVEVGGQPVYVRVLGVDDAGSDGRATAQIGVRAAQGIDPAMTFGGRVHVGSVFVVGTVQVRVVGVWKMPSQSHSAVDLELIQLP